jgi:hypothetical protein
MQPLHLENLYRGLHLLDYEQFCEALKLDPLEEESKIAHQELIVLDKAMRYFYQSELEAIALYFHDLKERDPRYDYRRLS